MKLVEQPGPPRWPSILWRMLTWISRKVKEESRSEEARHPKGQCPIFTPAARRNIAALELNAMVEKAALDGSRADLEDSIAALCILASVAHVLGNHSERDAAVDQAAEMGKVLASICASG